MNESGNSIGRRTPANMHTRVAAAYLVGRSVDTLKRWQKQGLVVPSQSMQAGKLRVWLYTDDDMMKLRDVAKRQKPGRKPRGKDDNAG